MTLRRDIPPPSGRTHQKVWEAQADTRLWGCLRRAVPRSHLNQGLVNPAVLLGTEQGSPDSETSLGKRPSLGHRHSVEGPVTKRLSGDIRAAAGHTHLPVHPEHRHLGSPGTRAGSWPPNRLQAVIQMQEGTRYTRKEFYISFYPNTRSCNKGRTLEASDLMRHQKTLPTDARGQRKHRLSVATCTQDTQVLLPWPQSQASRSPQTSPGCPLPPAARTY